MTMREYMDEHGNDLTEDAYGGSVIQKLRTAYWRDER